ncbi:hypothetical protein O8B39_13155 [Agrobacterium rhizogenes]|nr:hypothetical protein [Rhizobium rhizogenes]
MSMRTVRFQPCSTRPGGQASMEGGVDILSPLLLVLLVVLALPALSWVFYGLMDLRAYAAVAPPPVSDGILLEAEKVPALADELEPVCGVANCQHLPIPGNTSFSDFVKSKIRRFQGFIGGAGRTSGPMTTRPAAARKRHPLVAL